MLTKEDILPTVKTMLELQGIDGMQSHDAVLFSIEEAMQKVKNYCNISNIPKDLLFVVARIATTPTITISEEAGKELNKYKRLFR